MLQTTERSITMLFERQRVLLTLLDALGGECAPRDFQKLLFLYTRKQDTPSYEFVPYKYGCFSFSSCADKRRLIARSLLEDDEDRWKLTATGREVTRQRPVAAQDALRFHRQHASLRGDALVTRVYLEHPYYATRSVILNKILKNKADRERVAKSRPAHKEPELLTVGYEGKCLETYLNQLLRASVTLLCDVRRNPLSRKYGFSKSVLRTATENLGIRYEHLPELGIPSESRRALNSPADYEALFAEYRRECLPGRSDELYRIREWIRAGERVALTCFELCPHQCHRHCVAEALAADPLPNLKATHL